MAASDRFQYLQQVKHYNCLIKSLQSSHRNATATFGVASEQARFCGDMLRETMKEAEIVGVVVDVREGDVTDIDSKANASSSEINDDVTVALQELKERMAGVRIG